MLMHKQTVQEKLAAIICNVSIARTRAYRAVVFFGFPNLHLGGPNSATLTSDNLGQGCRTCVVRCP